MKQSILILLGAMLLLFYHTKSMAQDPNFTQFYHSNIYLNPATAGTVSDWRAATGLRHRWFQNAQSYRSLWASFDYNLGEDKGGLGAWVMQDEAGLTSQTQAALMYAYKFHLTEKWIASASLQADYTFLRLQTSNLRFEDEIITGLPTAEQRIDAQAHLFDMATGVLLYNSTFWLGAAAHHLLRPSRTWYEDGQARLPLRWSIHGGARFDIGERLRLSPALLFQQQQPFRQLDIGANIEIEPLFLGLWYRGIPLETVSPRHIDQDAMAIVSGVKIQNWTVAISYDFPFQNTSGMGGTYEISLIYTPQSLRTRSGFYDIDCPIRF
ncbi:MAG: PorP/SprF family type IX secretion system membrane protein [Bernardetiaceae bacterium]|nr:PorP/SprF family type IX secretion system membrane protein [Bernardetiaceae bacterium]